MGRSRSSSLLTDAMFEMDLSPRDMKETSALRTSTDSETSSPRYGVWEPVSTTDSRGKLHDSERKISTKVIVQAIKASAEKLQNTAQPSNAPNNPALPQTTIVFEKCAIAPPAPAKSGLFMPRIADVKLEPKKSGADATKHPSPL